MNKENSIMNINNNVVRNDIWSAVDHLPDGQLNQIVEPGKWTIMQVLEHLYLVERAITIGIGSALANEDEPAARKPYHLTLDRARKVDAPQHLVPQDAPIPLDAMKAKLEQSRAGLEAAVAGISSDVLKRKSYPHPVFGVMDVTQWIEFVGIHEKRHLAQIEELKKGL
jgi:uncharacterized damage-inducible protein DinB